MAHRCRHSRVNALQCTDHPLARADLPALWRRVEGATWLVAAAVYGGWFLLTWHHHALPWWLVLPLGGWLIGWHGGLQHEVIHGHPTRRPGVNAALAMLPVALWLPYPLYRSRHLSHHATPQLTDPLADTESFYVEPGRWRRLGPGRRALLRVHNTLAGRLLLGPALTILAFWREEGARLLRNEPGCVRIWAAHAVLTAAVLLWVLWVLRHPALGLCDALRLSGHGAHPAPLLHRAPPGGGAGPAHGHRGGRAADAAALPQQQLHALHHERPGIAWYELPRVYRAERERVLAENGGFLFAGYGDILRRFCGG